MNDIHQERIARVRQKLADEGLDAMMVSVQENRYYLSGFSGEDTQFDESAGSLIISCDKLVLATDGRYEEQARNEAIGFDIVCYKKGVEQVLPEIAGSLGVKRIGFESVRISHKNHAAMNSAIATMDPLTALIPTENIVESLRQIKSEEEIQHTIDALRLAEGAFSRVLAMVEPEMTEKAVAWEMEKAMREAGAQSLSFPVIVASGPNSALPHAVPTDRKLKRGEPILIDWGARLNAYCSDTTRTFVLGTPDDRFKKVYDTVVTARELAIGAIKEGETGNRIDRIAREHIRKNGFAGKFGHGLGHGTGLAVHESPRLSPMREDRLEAGMIVTVEPGVYLPGWGGIRMENQVVVKTSGARVLNDPAPFDPVVGA